MNPGPLGPFACCGGRGPNVHPRCLECPTYLALPKSFTCRRCGIEGVGPGIVWFWETLCLSCQQAALKAFVRCGRSLEQMAASHAA